MAVYEIDPEPWLPQGQQIIDGGPTRFPRTYYTPVVHPPCRHEAFYVAHLLPEQPLEEEPFWREQVSDLITNLGWAVDDFQPWIFGLGLVQMRSLAACNVLINHEPFQIQNDQFVRFARVEVGDYHRGFNGFRTGWLMFLGVHPDFCNDFDISNAVAAFGKYHHWHKDDPLKARTLVYASFPSPQFSLEMWFLVIMLL